MNKFLKFGLYFIFFVLYAIGLGRKIEDVTDSSDSLFVHDQSFGGRFKYLTSLDMVIKKYKNYLLKFNKNKVLQLFFFALCTLDQLFKLINLKISLKSALNFIYRSLAFPIGSVSNFQNKYSNNIEFNFAILVCSFFFLGNIFY